MDTKLYLSTGKAARALEVSADSVRRMCETGAIQAELTQGGQWRVPAEEIERLKRDGMPPLPRPLPGHGRRIPSAPRDHHRPLRVARRPQRRDGCRRR